MKGVVEEFFEKIGMHKKEKYDPNAGKSFLHPGRQANIIYDGKVVGYLGEVHPEVADTYGIGDTCIRCSTGYAGNRPICNI